MDIFEYDTYVFDFDGVVIDSEKYHWLSYQADVSYEKYCEINHSLTGPYFRETMDFTKKDQLYREYSKEIQLKKGFEDFYNKLLKLGKNVYIVTNTSQDIFDMFSEKFEFLKTIDVITGCKKPDPAGYFSIPQEDPTSIIAFEDSYRGFYAASKAIFTVVLVNSPDYYYFETINPVNAIEDFTKITDIKYKNITYSPFYISSKTHHRENWVNLKKDGFNVTSEWIMNDTQKELLTIKEKEELCHGFVRDIQKSDFGVFYSEFGDSEMIGSLIEFGIMTALGKPIYIMGKNIFEDEVFSHINSHVDFSSYSNKYNVKTNILKIHVKETEEYKNFIHEKSIVTVENEEKPLDYVAIVASGEGSRLMPLTRNIPKLLVSYRDRSILFHSIDYWKKYTKKFVIVIQSRYNRMVKYYMDLYGIDYEIINVNVSKGQENSYTIHNAFNYPRFENKRVLITWCDIFPVSEIPENIFGEDNVIFTYKNYGRYDASDNFLVKKAFGNVIGIYYFPYFKNITSFESHMDICDCFSENFGNFKVYEIENLVDIGDMAKLDAIIKNNDKYKTRYFNTITETEKGTLIKKSSSLKLIQDEMRFYKYYKFQNIIRYGSNFYEMEKIHGTTVHEYMGTISHNEQIKLVGDLISFISEFHSRESIPVSKNQLYNDVDIEFRKKVDTRINNVMPILEEFNFIKSVNNVPIIHSIKHIKDDMYMKIQEYFMNKTHYQSIHGDPHMSNIMKGFCFIDPRGYFGDTKLFGPSEYDIGKIMYSLSGFDYFNSDEKAMFYIEDDNISLNINNNIDPFLHLFKDSKICVYMTILHWLGLSDYTKLNVHKCVSAYYYGIYLYHLNK